ncbi:MAG TPA: hypothetical protein VMU58_08725 [Gaiellaceae bacterium]|nr:hypothetical protein [Gaiellaceae bacterium]
MIRRDPLADLEPLVQRVYAYVAYRIGDGSDAEAITATTFERALRHRAAFAARQGDEVYRLIEIAHGVLHEHDLKKRDFVKGDTTPGSGAAPRLLDEHDHELVALRYGADLSVAEIGALLELDVEHVEAALRRVLSRLQVAAAGSV